MKTTLPTLSKRIDLITHIDELEPYEICDAYQDVFDFNDFIKQPLKLEMIIPCKDGVPLEEPNEIGGIVQYPEEMKQYQKAKERVIFKGFEQIKSHNYKYLVYENTYNTKDKCGSIRLYYSIKYKELSGKRIISDLCNKVELTESEHKRLGL